MSTIQTSIKLVHSGSGIAATGGVNYTATSENFASNSIAVTTTEEVAPAGDVTVPRTVAIINKGPDTLRVGFTTGVYPVRLASGSGMLVELDVAGLLEATSVTALADSEGARLAGKHFVLNGASGAVWPWFNTAALKEITRITVASASTIGGHYFDLYDDTNALRRFWIDVDNASTPPSAGGGTLVEVDVLGADTAAQIQAKVLTAINTDAFFAAVAESTYIKVTALSTGTRTSCSTDSVPNFTVVINQNGTGTSTAPSVTTERLVSVPLVGNETAAEVSTAILAAFASDADFTVAASSSTINLFTDKTPGTRTDAGAGDSGFTVSTTQQGAASQLPFLKSAGTSQVVVAVAPN